MEITEGYECPASNILQITFEHDFHVELIDMRSYWSFFFFWSDV